MEPGQTEKPTEGKDLQPTETAEVQEGGDEKVEEKEEGGDDAEENNSLDSAEEVEARISVQQLKVGASKPKIQQLGLESSAFMEGDDDSDEGLDIPRQLVKQVGKARRVVDSYESPTKENIRTFLKKKRLYDKKADASFSVFTSIGSPMAITRRKSMLSENDVISSLGPGMMSYFHFLQIYGLAFFMFGLLALPAILMNVFFGEVMEGISRCTVGNLFVAEDLLGEVSDVFTFGKNNSLEVPRDFVTWYNVGYDILVCILFLIVVEYSIVVFKKADAKWILEKPNLENFTVEVTNLPQKIAFGRIEEFFNYIVKQRVYPKERERMKANKEAKLTKKTSFRSGDESLFDDEPVFDVQLVTTTRDQLTYAIEHARLVKRVDNMWAKLSVAKTRLSANKMSQRRYDLIELEYSRTEEALRVLSKKENHVNAEAMSTKVIKAFVTFNTLIAKEGVLEEYNKKLASNGCCQGLDPELLLEGHELHVTTAVAPSLVQWENMEYAKEARRRRSCFSWCLVLLVLLFSMGSLVLAGSLEDSSGFDAFFDQDCVITLDNETCLELIPSFTNLTTIETLSPEDLLIDFEDVQKNDCGAFFTCVCTQQLSLFFDSEEQTVCNDVLFQFVIAAALAAGPAVSVTLWNVVLEVIITFSVKNEKDHDRSKEDRKLFIRIFIATYINIAVVKTVQNLDFLSLFNLEVDLDSINSTVGNFLARTVLSGEYTYFTTEWYGDVGYELLWIAVVNIAGPHLFTTLRYFYNRLRRRCCPPLTYSEMERMYLGPEFLLPLRYAQIVVTLFFTLTYSSGMPILYFTAAVSCFVTFWVDKYFLFKFYRKPTLTNNRIVLWICRSMKLGIILHAFFSILIFSDPTLFPLSGRADSSILELLDDIEGVDISNITGSSLLENDFIARIVRFPVGITSLVFVLLIIYQILMQFEVVFKYVNRKLKIFVRFLFGCLVACLCCCCRRRRGGKNELLDDLDELERLEEQQTRHKLHPEGLAIKSYNILANERYAKNFKLKDKMSFSTLLAQKRVLHSTADVLPLLDFMEEEKVDRFVFERGNTPKSTKTVRSKEQKSQQ